MLPNVLIYYHEHHLILKEISFVSECRIHVDPHTRSILIYIVSQTKDESYKQNNQCKIPWILVAQYYH